jgi:hypothetical protein
VPIIQAADRLVRRCKLAVGAFVVTVIEALVVAAVPFAVIVAGENRQVASEGRPEHARLMVPLKPVELETLIDVEPTPPGAEIKIVDSVEGIAP